jgi:hypothetical protein
MTSQIEKDFNAAVRQAIAQRDSIPQNKVTDRQILSAKREVEKFSDLNDATRSAKAKIAAVDKLFTAMLKR